MNKPTIRIRKEIVGGLREYAGLETDRSLAKAMGINAGNLSRTLNGRQQPGPRFIASLCIALNASMNELFVIVEESEIKDAAA